MSINFCPPKARVHGHHTDQIGDVQQVLYCKEACRGWRGTPALAPAPRSACSVRVDVGADL